jgi:nucleoid-associated protein YgaU
MSATPPTSPPTARVARAARAWVSIAAALAALASTPAARALTPADVFAKVSDSVWVVRTYDKEGLALGLGSAVVIGTNTLVTNCHVLRKAARFTASHEKTVLEGTLELWDPPRDICQFKVRDLKAPAVALGNTDQLVVGQSVYAIGNPKGLELTLSSGLISSLRHDEQQRLADIQISAPISPGSSGGGLFDDEGRLIGITSSGVVGDGVQNLNFARPVDYVRELPARQAAAQAKRAAAASAAAPSIAAAPAPAVVTAPQAAPTTALTDRVPFLNDTRQAGYQSFLQRTTPPRACAISDNGHYACASGTRPKDTSLPTDPKERALQTCTNNARKACILYVVDNTVVYRSAP